MSRYIGNYLRVPASEPTQSTAPGIWSISEQLAYQRANLWPPARDPYYNQTVLHLTGNVPNVSGPQAMNLPLAYNSDASSNNFVITPNGDVSPRPFSPYLENYSAYAAGNTYVDIASNSGFNLSDNANFTIEFWINCPVTTGALWIASGWQTTSNLSWSLSWRSNNAIEFYGRQSSGGAGTIYYVNNSGDNTVLPNTWTHYAVVRNGSNISVYVNGNLINIGTINGTPAPSTNCRFFGDSLNGSQLIGYLSNFRFSRSAIYTQPFTPSTQPLTTLSQGASSVVFLGFNKNRFVDVANNLAFTFTSGSPRVTDNSPFVSADFTSGAGYFDGNGDYLNVVSDSNLALGTGDFTIEMWMYPTLLSATFHNFFDFRPSGTQGAYPALYVSNSTFNYYANNAIRITNSTVPTVNAWNHIALVRSGTTTKLYLNGSQVGNDYTSDTSNYLCPANRPGIAANGFTTADPLPGYISGIRILKGTALYTGSTYTVPTAPLTAIANTQLLTLQTRAASQNIGFIDSSPNRFIVTKNGNTTQGTFSPFSPTGWGNYFAGPTNYFSFSSSLFALGTDGFTIDGWIYLTAYSYSAIFSTWLSAFSSNNGIMLGTNSSGNLELNIGNAAGGGSQNVVSASVIPLNTWVFIQGTKAAGSGGVMKIYINGNDVTPSTVTTTRSVNLTSGVVGRYYVDSSAHGINGYISNVRVSNTVRSSTVPTAPFSVDANTVFLSCQANRFRDAGPGNVSLTVNGTPSVQAFSPFAPATQSSPLVTGGSGYFDGTGSGTAADYLTVPDSPVFTLGSGDFTLETWIYSTVGSGAERYYIAHTDNATAAASQFALYQRSADAFILFEYYVSTTANSITSGAAITLNQWNHIAVCRSNGTLSMFVNGVRPATGTTNISTTAFNDSASALGIGGRTSGAALLTGNISGMRLVRGTDVYGASNTNIVVPTAPPTAIPNTSLLLNFTGGGIVDATGRHVLETVGNSHKSTSQVKFAGTASEYFDGTSDYLTIRDNPLLELGSGDFTIEAWVYPLNNSSRSIFGHGPDGQNWWAFYLDGTGKLEFAIVSGNSTVVDRISSTTVNTNTWTHVAVTRSGSTFRLFIDGQEPASYTGSPATTSAAAPDFSSDFWIGGQRWSGSGNSFQGYIQDLRITRGIARYTSNFTINTTIPVPFRIG